MSGGATVALQVEATGDRARKLREACDLLEVPRLDDGDPLRLVTPIPAAAHAAMVSECGGDVARAELALAEGVIEELLAQAALVRGGSTDPQN